MKRYDKVYLLHTKNFEEVANKVKELVVNYTNQVNLKNGKILVKPNVVGPYNSEKGVTTNPKLIKKICDILKNEGFTVLMGDCPGGNYKNIKDTFFQTGILDLCRSYYKNICRDLDEIYLNCRPDKSLYVSSLAASADIVLSLAKFKTSCYMIISGAVKNLFGIVPGALKANLHQEFIERDEFARLLIDISLIPKKTLAVVDGSTVMEGNGPVHGLLRTENIFIISESLYAADFIMAKLMGLNKDSVPTVKSSLKKKLINPKKIKVISSKSFEILNNFILPITLNDYLNKVKSIIDPNLKRISNVSLVVDPEFCILCGECVENCPTKSIVLEKLPIINEDTCIRCFCCNELCNSGAIQPKENIQKIWEDIIYEESN